MNKNILKYLFAAGLLIGLVAAYCERKNELVILHTNDTHSQVEVIDPKVRYSGNTGGYVRRLEMIERERKEWGDVLLVDAGDFSQGTPYFNVYKGAVEIDAMNKMGYDVATLGNHEFDNPVDTIAKYLAAAEFAVVVSNYDVEQSPLKGMVKKYHVVKKGGVKVGIVGAGINPEGLVSAANHKGVVWSEPIAAVNEYAEMLKEEEDCDVVVCLSHLGYDYGESSDQPSDVLLAKNSKHIDVIIGGHTHSHVVGKQVENLDGKPVLIGQMRKSGTAVGRIVINDK